tara:strand:- start:68 stop:307 length:240 start_codon:yes stop_codon:yes gene_type:complete
MAVMAYEVTVDIDGNFSIITLDDTYPAVSDWSSASEFAIHMAMHMHPDSEIEFIDCTEYEHEVYSSWGKHIYETPTLLQ